MPDETLVLVNPTVYAAFTKPTMIDYNQVFELDRAELVARHQARDLRSHPDLPSSVLSQVCEGILASPRVDEAHKDRIRS